MFKKYSILLTIIISLLLLFIATVYYPGGSQADKNSVGYDWKNNYISNLFSEKAVNGAENKARFWATAGMFFLSMSFALFFAEFSKKIYDKSAARVIKYFGIIAMAFGFLAVTPLHDIVITVADTLLLVSMFYITVFIFRTKLHLFKALCIMCLLFSYACTYMYYVRTFLEFLPIMQKSSLALEIIWMLSLQYFTKAEDLLQKKKAMA